MPIGNLTSQIFANIYLNEFDRFVKHRLKPKAYLRYGDDFILIETDIEKLKKLKMQATDFIQKRLRLNLNQKNDVIIRPRQGLRFLGVVIYSNGRTLNKRSWKRIQSRLDARNISSYSGLIKQHGSKKRLKEFEWISTFRSQ